MDIIYTYITQQHCLTATIKKLTIKGRIIIEIDCIFYIYKNKETSQDYNYTIIILTVKIKDLQVLKL